MNLKAGRLGRRDILSNMLSRSRTAAAFLPPPPILPVPTSSPTSLSWIWMTLNPRGGKLSCRNTSAALAHFLQMHFTGDGEESGGGDSRRSESLNTILSLSVVSVITLCDQLFGAFGGGPLGGGVECGVTPTAYNRCERRASTCAKMEFC